MVPTTTQNGYSSARMNVTSSDPISFQIENSRNSQNMINIFSPKQKAGQQPHFGPAQNFITFGLQNNVHKSQEKIDLDYAQESRPRIYEEEDEKSSTPDRDNGRQLG